MQSSSRGKAKVRLLAVHTTEGITRAADLRAWTTWAGSSHASADETGVLLSGSGDGFVDYGRSAWTMLSANPISDQIELCAFAKWKRPDWLARPLLLDACARWLAERSVARGIPLVHLTVEEIRAGKPGVIGHVDWTHAVEGTHTDPGPGFPWDVVLDRARAYVGGSTPPLSEEDDMNAAQEAKLDRATNAAEGVWRMLKGAHGDGADRLTDLWGAIIAIRDPAQQSDPAAVAAALAQLLPKDIAEQVAAELVARLAS